MSNIREYDSPVKGIDPSSAAANSYKELGNVQASDAAQSGRAIGGAISNIGEFGARRQQAAEKDEINKLRTTFALQELNNAEGWDAASAGGDGQDIAKTGQAYIDKKFAEIDATVEAATTPEGKAWAAQEATRQKIALMKSVHADTSTIAGYTAVTNVETAVNAKLALVQNDPSQLDTVLGQLEETIGASIPKTVDATTRAKALTESTLKAKQQAVQYAIQATINGKNPQTVVDAFTSGAYKKYADAGLIDPGVYNAILPAAQQAVKNKESAAKADDAALRATQRLEFETAATKLVGGTLMPDGKRVVTGDYFKSVQELSGKPGVTYNDIENLTAYGEAVLNGKTAKVNDPATVADFTKRMFSTGADKLTEAEVYKAVVEGKLTADAYGDGMFINAIKASTASTAADPTRAKAVDDLYQNAFHVFDAPPSLIPDAVMNAEEQKAQQWFAPNYLSRLKSPTNPNGKSADELLNPASPDYIWKSYPGLTAGEKAKLQTFYPAGVPAPAGAVPAKGGAVVPPVARPPLGGFFGFGGQPPAAGVIKPQASVDPGSTGSIPPHYAPAGTDQATLLPIPASWGTASGAIGQTNFVAPAAGVVQAPQELIDSGKLVPNAPVRAAAVRLNNMGAISIVSSNNNWVTQLPGYVGKVARPANEGGYYAQFATPEQGIHAASVLLERYGAAGTDTPNEIVRRWSADPNAWAHYASVIAKYVGPGVTTDTVLDLTNAVVRKGVLMAQSAVESGLGKPIYREDVFDAGVSMA